ncbi:MAG: DUF305 domain-containing protein [Patescibacteria group bacterium]
MKNQPFLYGIIGLLSGGVLTILFISNTININNTGIMRMMGIRQGFNATITSNIDKHFIEQMIPHHEDAITMAKLAQTKAQRSEVKQLANTIIDSQGKEITQMKDWYTDWFGKAVPTGNQVMNQHGMGNTNGMHMGMMGDASDATRLEQAENFDKVFVEAMIPHHQMAVMMATMLKGGTNRPEMTQLADDIITAQTKEINLMRGWLTTWSR